MTKIIQDTWSDINIAECLGYHGGFVSICHSDEEEIRIEISKVREVALAIYDFEKEMIRFADWITLNDWFMSSDDSWYCKTDGKIDGGINSESLLKLFKSNEKV